MSSKKVLYIVFAYYLCR